MKWLFVVVLFVIAAVLGLVGFLASIDPEGRGGTLAGWLFSAAAVVAVLAISLVFL